MRGLKLNPKRTDFHKRRLQSFHQIRLALQQLCIIVLKIEREKDSCINPENNRNALYTDFFVQSLGEGESTYGVWR